tara:strand:- start:2492 stop:2764 length:273 start_codon:yes stop_codon:yes gene_type:complete
MTNNTILPDVSEGVAEPSSSRVVLVMIWTALLGLIAMFSNIFGWDSLPVIGEIIPFMDNLGGSAIWYYLIGILVGCGMMISNIIGGVLSD